MFLAKERMIAAIAITLLLVAAAFGQQATTPAPPRASAPDSFEQQTTPQPALAPTARGNDYVEEKGFKTKVIELKYRDPEAIQMAIRALGSGFKGAKMDTNSEFKTLTVRDFPENIASIEEAVKRLDTPQAPRSARPEIEFHIHVLIASNATSAADDFPSELSEVLKQLQGTLRYKNYGLMSSSVHRASQGNTGVQNKGVAESKLFNVSTPLNNPILYEYYLSPLFVRETVPGAPTVEVGTFSFSMRIPIITSGQTQQIQYDSVGFRSPVTIRDGEKVVVGTTTMGDKGLVVVVTAKIIKP
ncbi:MAG: secretin N-terminal domain-containing protein [Blastocatellia bacterium]